VRVDAPDGGAERLATALRRGTPPLFVRIRDGALVLDPRPLLDGEEALVVAAFERLAPRDGGKPGGVASSEGA
jgi:hypothetical protein